MQWVEVHATAEDTATAGADACARFASAFGEESPDLLLAFFTSHHVPAAESLAETLKTRLKPGCLAGISGGAVVTTSQEIESGPALVLVGARMPGVQVKPFILVPSAWGEAMNDAAEFERHTSGVTGAEMVVLLGDPFTLDVERVLGSFHTYAPGVRVVGGMASAGMRPAANALILNDWVAREGGIGIALSGALRVDVVVSQGCRPIGPPLTVTRAENNMIYELDGQPALERTEQVLRDLGDREKEMLKQGIYVGRPARGDATGRGDYLIRNLLGADRDQGVMAVGDRIREKEKIRLHVRDADTAREDLELLLAPQEFDSRAAGALLFSCNGRGRKLFGVPDRDLTTLQRALGGDVPTAGFFCAGEIGPVGGRSFLHGHTASIAIIRPRTATDTR
jgi:small ligand-binding sensory domain FIST